ncbi:preprotein translocase subunit SecE [Stratiformator vulcanicus]|uniref:Protein translocase subunit SecE n=1 Tax=Stratiformator vulcanicus TaxID=2527980 RepID=A0A517R0N2_9PLAN|nr:preprotein translocase subunit SecE [Stratiformator vulcanicus]QDT37390.1 preprotein translocase subunit SecE [Stratiformator vulcanicus]
MAKAKAVGSIWSALLSANLYKRNQGRLVRQVTVLSLCAVIFIGCYILSQGPLADRFDETWISVGIPTLLAVVGAWIAFRVVNYPKFADFLVSVEAEMDKVSWPSRAELYRSTIVVIAVMFLLAGMLFLYDTIWLWLFRAINVVKF